LRGKDVIDAEKAQHVGIEESTAAIVSVLVVDDDPTTRRLVRVALTDGFTVEEAEDGRHGLLTFESLNPDIVLLDCMMPAMDGFATCEAIRKLPAGRDVPILMMTALEDNESVRRAYDAGASDFYVKPVRPALLRQRIKYILRMDNLFRRLSKAEAENRAVVRGIPDPVFRVKNMSGTWHCWHANLHPIRPVVDEVAAKAFGALAKQLTAKMFETSPKIVARRGTDVFEGTLTPAEEKVYYEARVTAIADNEAIVVVRNVSERKREEEDLAWELRVNQSLAKLGRALLHSTSVEQASSLVLEYSKDLTGSSVGYAGYIDPQTGLVNSPTIRSGVWEACQVKSKESLFQVFHGSGEWQGGNGFLGQTDSATMAEASNTLPHGHIPIERALSVPAKIGDLIVGRIMLANAAIDYTKRDVEVAERLSNIYALAIQNRIAQDALLSSEEKFRLLFEQSTDAHLLVSNGAFVDCNQAAVGMFGFAEKNQLMGLSFSHVSPERQPDGQLSSLAIEYFKAEASSRGGYMFDFAYKKVSGEEFPSEAVFTVIAMAGEPIYHVVIRDITSRKKAEQSARQLAALVQSSDDGIIGVALDGTVLSWNRGAERVFGYSEEEMCGHSILTLLPPDLRESSRMLGLISKGERIEQYESVRLTKDGRRIHVSVTLSPVTDSAGTVIGSSVIIRDITDRKIMRAQIEQARKLESIGQLAAGIAHEINTPTQYVGDNIHFLDDSFRDLLGLLSRYRELLQAAKEQRITQDQVEDLERTVEETDVDYLTSEIPSAIEQSLEGVGRISKIVGAMKEFSHPGNNDKKAVDMNRAVENTITVCRNEWKYVANVITDLDPALPVVRCLPSEFNQVLLNIIINAAQAIGASDRSKDALGTIVVSTKAVDGWCEIVISDDGPGMAEDVRARIFDPFFTTKAVGKGTGQGLAIARSIVVDKHGGTITVDSENGNGASFKIRIPYE
jgi:PAS domain S-box-containing protein